MDGRVVVGVTREVAIAALRAADVGVSEKKDDDGIRFTLVKGDVVEVQYFPEVIPRALIGRLSGKFGVPPEYFWHPEMIPAERRPPGLLPN